MINGCLLSAMGWTGKTAEAKAAESTLTALSSWMSRKNLERRSHTMTEVKRRAIEMLVTTKMACESPQKSPYPEAIEEQFIQ